MLWRLGKNAVCVFHRERRIAKQRKYQEFIKILTNADKPKAFLSVRQAIKHTSHPADQRQTLPESLQGIMQDTQTYMHALTNSMLFPLMCTLAGRAVFVSHHHNNCLTEHIKKKKKKRKKRVVDFSLSV